ncbi:hypothetical protein ACEQPO_06470 [Bacillus sp. SL00103]
MDLDVLVQHNLKKGKSWMKPISLTFNSVMLSKRISAGRRLFILPNEISERSHRLFDEKKKSGTCH